MAYKMTYNNLKKRKSNLFVRIMTDKYAGVRTPASVVSEYRYLQREEKRRIVAYKQSA